MSARDVRLVQTFYPQIYLACHTRHTRAASSPRGLSARDSSRLAHLDEKRPTTPSVLAEHLGVSASTMSAAVKRLIRLGYIDQRRHPADARSIELRLATKGAAAMRDSSVLEPVRVEKLLSVLTSPERRAALNGLALLAQAARRVMERDRDA